MGKKLEDINALLQKMQLPPLAQLLGAKFLFLSELDDPLAGFVEGVLVDDVLEKVQILSPALGADRADGRAHLFISCKDTTRLYFVHNVPRCSVGEFIIL